ncbi:MAG TPA: DUF4339 domain-containing protein [Polyangia bacterium]|nr:DUF4339 domain-containing protein [Polyangia bacterium]
MSDADAWWYESSGQRLGPIPLAELKAMIAAGTVVAQTRVWKQGMADWVIAGSVRALFAEAPPERPDLGMRMLLPVGRSGFAIAAGYLGLCSFIPIVGVLAIIFATLAVLDLRKHPEKTGWGRILTGYILGTLATVLYGLAFVH